MEKAELALLERLALTDPQQTPVIFVLGSPRTGSTLFYQAVVRAFRLPYPCNLANDLFASTPALVAPLLKCVLADLDIAFTSAYGKTQGPYQPSEGSAIVRRWCGGGHPSQLVSTQVLTDQRTHMAQTLAAYFAIFQKPLVIKNAWNCFRIQSLATLFPNAYFLWIRRDVVKSALSDLAARYTVQGDPLTWNSATPARVAEISKLPYWAQVVENQYEYSQAIENALLDFVPQRHGVFWYEDFLRNPKAVMELLGSKVHSRCDIGAPEAITLQPAEQSPRPFQPGDEPALKKYVEEHQHRLSPLRYSA